jgi:hypothetical protein
MSCDFKSLQTIYGFGPRFIFQLNEYHTLMTYGKFCLTAITHA